MHQTILPTFMLAISIILAGCGGGGSGSSSPTASTNTSTTTTPATPTVPPAVVQSFQVAVTPSYATSSEEFGYFNAVNAFRTAQGLGPLNQNIYYDEAATAHANYIYLNGASHLEVPGLPDYTGETPLARVQYQAGVISQGEATEWVQPGCSVPQPTPSQCVANFVQEVVGLPDFQDAVGSGASFAGVLINTVYHRAGLMYQGQTDIGVSIGMIAPPAMGASSVSEMGAITQQVNAGTYFGVYPTPGLTGVGLHFHAGGESPSPLPAGTDFTQIGYPISVASQESTTLTVTSFTVTQAGTSAVIPGTIITSSDPNLTGSNNLAFLLANQAFLPNTTYNVSFIGMIAGTATGSATGIPVSKQWSFTTGTTSD